MYVDFDITKTGDLVYQLNNEFHSPYHLSFTISKFKTQRLQMNINNNVVVNNDGLKISFFIKDKEEQVKNKIKKDDEALIQLILLQLKTVLAEESYRTENGSKLCDFIHENITDEKLKELELYLTEFLSDYLYNPVVECTPYIQYKGEYKQAVKIYVYNNETLLLQYLLGE